MAPESALLAALTQPEQVAAAADLAWARGEDREAAQLRLRLLREVLSLRDRLAIVTERSASARRATVVALESDLVEDLIAGHDTVWPVGTKVATLLDAVVELLRDGAIDGDMDGGVANGTVAP